MKGLSNRRAGISLVEVVLALAIGTILLVTIFESIRQIEDGFLWSQFRLQTYKQLTNTLKKIQHDEIHATSTFEDVFISRGQEVSSTSCSNQLCLVQRQLKLSDVTCGQKHVVSVGYQLRPGDRERFFRGVSYLIDTDDFIRRGADCSWLYQDNGVAPVTDTTTFASNFESAAIDVFDRTVVVVGSSSPQLRVYEESITSPGIYTFKIASLGDGRRINAVDVFRHVPSGRLFAYVLFHDRVNQLGVFELLPDAEPVFITTRSLSGAVSTGSFPQGWRLVVYGTRVFALTRETAGSELHVFSILDPTAPVEIVSARTELSRTVNDFDVFGFKLQGHYKEYLFMVASAALKEFAIFDVTGVIPNEIMALNLPGTSNAEALSVTATKVFIGRQAVAGGPELYQYTITNLLQGSTSPLATYEVGAGVSNITATGAELIVTTSRSPSDIDRYAEDALLWQTNNARLNRTSVAGLLPYTVDRTGTGAVLLRRSSGEESIINLHQP